MKEEVYVLDRWKVRKIGHWIGREGLGRNGTRVERSGVLGILYGFSGRIRVGGEMRRYVGRDEEKMGRSWHG